MKALEFSEAHFENYFLILISPRVLAQSKYSIDTYIVIEIEMWFNFFSGCNVVYLLSLHIKIYRVPSVFSQFRITMVYFVKECSISVWRGGENTEHICCTVSQGHGSAHLGRRKLGLQEFQEPEIVQRSWCGAMLGLLRQEVLSPCDFNALEDEVGVDDISWVMKNPLVRLGRNLVDCNFYSNNSSTSHDRTCY